MHPLSESATKRDEELLCAQCKHKVVSHGNLLKLKSEQLDKLLAVVLQIEHYISEGSKTTDPTKKQKYLDTIQTLKQ